MISSLSARTRHPGRLRLLALGALVAILSGMCAVLGGSPAVSADRPVRCRWQQDLLREQQARHPRERVGHRWAPVTTTIQGFATDISVNVGLDDRLQDRHRRPRRTPSRSTGSATTAATVPARSRRVTPSATLPQNQPQCITDATTELYDCGNWAVSASWNVPSTAVSGRLHRPARTARRPATAATSPSSSATTPATPTVVFQTSDPTWQAYNTYGGSDFYQAATNGRAYKVSYNRPVLTRGGIGGRDFFFTNEYPMIRFLEQNGYDVSYIAGVDTDRRGSLLKNHKIFLSVGHDEYWCGAQRANVEAARDAGVNLQFLSGNEIYWQTRYEASADGSHTAYRTLVCYKETWANAKIDPVAGVDRHLARPAVRPVGQGRRQARERADRHAVHGQPRRPGRHGQQRRGQAPALAQHLAGQPAARAPARRSRRTRSATSPTRTSTTGSGRPGWSDLSTTTGPTPEYLQDFGNTVVPGTTTHHLTLYRAASGALVFGAGIDPVGVGPRRRPRQRVRPRSRPTSGCSRRRSTCSPTWAPSRRRWMSDARRGDQVDRHRRSDRRRITSPAAGSAQANGAKVTVTGTATDAGGGASPASRSPPTAARPGTRPRAPRPGPTPTSSTASGSQTVQVRAIDDSANIGASATRAFSVELPVRASSATSRPSTPPRHPPTTPAVELGLRFRATAHGFVTGVRFYKGTGNSGTHTGIAVEHQRHAARAHVTFTSESATGWQTVSFANPVAVTPARPTSSPTPLRRGTTPCSPGRSPPPASPRIPLAVDGGFGAAPAGVFASLGRFPDQSSRNAELLRRPAVHHARRVAAGGDQPVAAARGEQRAHRPRR